MQQKNIIKLFKLLRQKDADQVVSDQGISDMIDREFSPDDIDWGGILASIGLTDINTAKEDLDIAISDETDAPEEDYEAIEQYAQQGRFLQNLADQYRGQEIYLDGDEATMEKCSPITYGDLTDFYHSAFIENI